MSEQEEALTPDDAALKQAAIIAEYNSLRGEIADRSRDQLVCVSGSLVATAALLGAVAAAADPSRLSGLLLVAPWILSVFGILWCNHAYAIFSIAVYLREEIEQNKMPAIGWETYIAKRRKTSSFLNSINFLVPMLYFALPSMVFIAYYIILRFWGGTTFGVLKYSFIGLVICPLIAFFFSWRRAFRQVFSLAVRRLAYQKNVTDT